MDEPRKRSATRHSYALMIAAVGGCFVVWASLFIYRSSSLAIDGKRYFALVDDAMISMRYAWNFSHGYGLVWNPGEHVEGYTNPLMTLLMSLATLLFNKVEAVLAIQVLGIVFMLVNAYLVVRIAEHLISGHERYRTLFLTLAFVCALSYYPLLYWSLMGMETGLLTVLVSLSVLLALGYARDRRPAQAVLLSVSLGLAFLTRPDSVVLAVPIFAYAIFAHLRSDRSVKGVSLLLAMGGIYAVFIVGQELFRWSYYGEWLPNTYTLKVSGIPLLTRIENGMLFVAPFLKEVSVCLIIVGASVVFAFRREKVLVVGVFGALVFYQVWAGGEPSDYWRILSPAVPLILVLATHAILTAAEAVFDSERTDVSRREDRAAKKVPSETIIACLVVVGMLVSVNVRFLPEIAMLKKPYDSRLNEVRIDTGLAIEQVTTPDATVGVITAGTIPYYSGRPAIDFLGKADPHIARLPPRPARSGTRYFPGHNKYDLEYSIMELKPTYVQEFNWVRDNVLPWAKSRYVKVKYEGVPLYLLKDSRDVYWADIEGPRKPLSPPPARDG